MSHFRSEFASDFICCFVDDDDERRDPLRSLDFSGLSVLDALRLFLGAARQAGGGADTDAFAERYCLLQEGVQSHTSIRAACHALVRSYLLLDTALHRGDAKVPMSETAFLSEACRLGREGGAELPPRLLADAYRSILAIPLPEAPAPRPRPQAAGCGGFGRPVCAGLCCYFCCSDKGGGGGEGGTAPLRAVPASMERHIDPIDVDPMECDLPVVGFRQLSLCKELDETLSQGEACSGEAHTGESCPLGNAGQLSLGGKVHALFDLYDAHRPPGAGFPFPTIDLPPAADGSSLFDDEVCGMAVDDPGGGGGGGGGGSADAPLSDRERLMRSVETAALADVPAPGRMLLANPAKFCSRNPFARPVKDLGRFGLDGPVSPDEMPPDLTAQMLPVLLLLEHGEGGSSAVLLERRTVRQSSLPEPEPSPEP